MVMTLVVFAMVLLSSSGGGVSESPSMPATMAIGGQVVETPSPPVMPETKLSVETSESVHRDTEAAGSCSKVTTPMWSPEAFLDAAGGHLMFCSQFGDVPISEPELRPRIIYGAMFNFEADMLEVAMHQVYRIVDRFYVVESSITHSTKTKVLEWPEHSTEERFLPFRDKVKHLVFEPKKTMKSGWDVEKQQRVTYIEEMINGKQNGLNLTFNDIVMANMDLDEIPSRTMLMRFKYCKMARGTKLFYRIFHFRYHLGCLQTLKVDDLFNTMFFWPAENLHTQKAIKKEIYKRREHRVRREISSTANLTAEFQHPYTTWHMSAFGGMKAIMRKHDHSPHRFVGDFPRKEVERAIKNCEYNDQKMFRVNVENIFLDPPAQKGQPDRLPYLIQRNMCYYKQQGWFGTV